MNVSTVMRWTRKNLFSTPADVLISLLIIGAGIHLVLNMARWILTDAQWAVVTENLRVFMVGTYPGEMIVRAWLSASVMTLLCGMSIGSVAGAWRSLTTLIAAIAALYAAASVVVGSPKSAWIALCVFSFAAGWLAGGTFNAVRKSLSWVSMLAVMAILIIMSPDTIERWGGLLMSVLFTLLASALSVPIGIALALGRRSRHPSARLLCSAYIELMRSLPLILVVYGIWVTVPLLIPNSPGPDLLRGLLGFTLFFSAYVAEYVRSGLQSLPRGQMEAAQSLGMSPRQVNRDIVLPQALRIAIPGLVGNVLDIFNTVPLLFIIGMTDFLRAGQTILVNPQSGNRTYEIYVFMFAVYLVIASLITFAARRLEARMSAGHA